MLRYTIKYIIFCALTVTTNNLFADFRIMPSGSIVSDEYMTPIKLGIDTLENRKFDLLAGKNVGLLTTSYTSNSNGEFTWQVLSNAKNFNLVAVFDAYPGLLNKNSQYLENRTAELLGLADDSNYSKRSTMTPSWLNLLDVLVIDLQDTGSRFGQNIHSMIYALVECFERGVEVVILDRPNPIGDITGGPCVDKDNISFYEPIEGMPFFHGLTIGEVANFVKESKHEVVIQNQIDQKNIVLSPETMKNGKLTIIPVEAWPHSMLWADTGLLWSSSSKKLHDEVCINDFTINALAFICSSFGENAPIWNFHHLEESNRYFSCISSKELDIVSTFSKLEKQYFAVMTGVQLSYIIDNVEQCLFLNTVNLHNTVPCGISLFLISEAQSKLAPWKTLTDQEKQYFLKTIGDTEFCQKLFDGEEIDVKYFLKKWEEKAKLFKAKLAPYLLY